MRLEKIVTVEALTWKAAAIAPATANESVCALTNKMTASMTIAAGSRASSPIPENLAAP